MQDNQFDNQSDNQPVQLEQAMAELDKILEQLENNEISLEESIKSFEKGVGLVKHCQKILEATEQKIKGLTGSE